MSDNNRCRFRKSVFEKLTKTTHSLPSYYNNRCKMADTLSFLLLAFIFFQIYIMEQYKKQLEEHNKILHALDVVCLNLVDFSDRNKHIDSLFTILRLHFGISSTLYAMDNTFIHIRKFNDSHYCTHQTHLNKQTQIKHAIQNDITELLESKYADIDTETPPNKYDVITFLETQFTGNMADFVDRFEKTFL